ncbi:MAG: ABC transporter ATP-binding protein [Bilophila sp.]
MADCSIKPNTTADHKAAVNRFLVLIRKEQLVCLCCNLLGSVGLAGLDKADRGTVSTGGRDGKTGNISFILQDYGLFPWKTVAENLALPLDLRGEGRTRRREAVAAMLDELGLTGLGPRYPVQLSGGQRQRVAIGRALITDPDILLMDEPFSSLDALTREHLQRTVLSLWRRRRPTCVLVTHNVPEAVFLGRRVMVLSGRPARKTLAR